MLFFFSLARQYVFQDILKTIDVFFIQRLIHAVYFYFAVFFHLHVRLMIFYEGLHFGNSGNGVLISILWFGSYESPEYEESYPETLKLKGILE